MTNVSYIDRNVSRVNKLKYFQTLNVFSYNNANFQPDTKQEENTFKVYSAII